jgi:hypothetical protein
MAEQLNLNKYKRSDVYTVEVDRTQALSLPLSQGRLVIGSSRKGPINTVVQINDPKSAKAVYGDIDSKLESKGSFFHRTIQTLLKEGPVFALNVLPVDTTDTVKFATFNTEAASSSVPASLSTYTQEISKFFNTQRFWYASADALNGTKNDVLTGANKNKILSFVNLSKRQITVFTQAVTVNGYDMTVKEYYSLFGEDVQIPNFLNEDDLISDYFVEAVVVEGDWSDYIKLGSDPIYKAYFSKQGLIKDKLNDFLNLREVKVVARATGSIIPGFKDQSGQNASLDRIFNSLYTQTEVICAIDTDSLESVDLEATSFTDATMSSHRLDLIGHGFSEITDYSDNDVLGDDTAIKQIDLLSYRKPSSGTLRFPIDSVEGAAGVTNTTTGGDFLKAFEESKLYEAIMNGFIVDGMTIKNGSTTKYIKLEYGLTQTISAATVKYVKITVYDDTALTTLGDASDMITTGTSDYITIETGGAAYSKEFTITDTTFFAATGSAQLAPNQLKLVLNSAITSPNKAILDSFVKVNHYIKAKIVGDSRPRMLKIISVAASTSGGTTTYTVTTLAPTNAAVQGIDLTANKFTVYKGYKNFVTDLKGINLPAFAVREALLPNGTSARENTIYEFLFEDTNIPKALADKQSFDFRYIVDSFQGQIASSSKFYLAKLAAMHGQAFVIANAPSMKQFEKSIDPSFIDANNKLLSAQYIAQGGNLDLNPSFTYAFAQGEVNGVPVGSYIGYFLPNVLISDGGLVKSVPPAAYVANAFMKKFNSGNTFSIVAAKKGALTDAEIENLEYEFTDEDRDFLEPAGFNPIVKRRGFGKLIMGNNTGYQKVNSALNNIHVREALITIEKDVNNILFNFLMDFNDEITQLRVRTIVENYLDAVMAARGITYYEVQFNSDNNTPDVLISNSAIIDIVVEFPSGIHKFINRITMVRNQGQLNTSSTGFIPSF